MLRRKLPDMNLVPNIWRKVTHYEFSS